MRAYLWIKSLTTAIDNAAKRFRSSVCEYVPLQPWSWTWRSSVHFAAQPKTHILLLGCLGYHMFYLKQTFFIVQLGEYTGRKLRWAKNEKSDHSEWKFIENMNFAEGVAFHFYYLRTNLIQKLFCLLHFSHKTNSF